MSIDRARYRTRRLFAGLDGNVIAIAIAAVLLVGTRQAYTVPYTGLGLSPAELILFVLMLLWVATRLSGQRTPAGLGVLSGLLVIRLSFVLISFGLAAGRVLSVDQRNASDRTLGFEFAVVGVVVALATLLRSLRAIEMVLRGLVIGGAISGFFAIVQYATGADLAGYLHLPGLRDTGELNAATLLRLGVVRSQGSAGAPLELGGVMAVLIPLGLGLTLVAQRRGQRWWVWAGATLIMAGGAVVSLSRVVFVAFGFALVVMIARWPLRRTGGLLAVLAGIALAASASGSRAIDAISQTLTSGSQDYSLGSRTNGRSYVWQHFADHFWFGQGPGTYDQVHQPVLDNQYLSQLMETGALGLIMFGGVLLCGLAYALRATARAVGRDAADLATAIAASITSVMVVSSVLDTAGFVQIYALTWIMVGLSAAIWRVNVADTLARPRRGAVSAR